MHWQSNGDFLCVVLAKKGKVKDGKEQAGGKAKNLDILRLREKNIPVETVEVEEGIKGTIQAFCFFRRCCVAGSHFLISAYKKLYSSGR